MRECTACKEIKPLTSFSSTGRNGYKRRECRVCRAQYNKERHANQTKHGINVQGWLAVKYSDVPCLDCDGVYPHCAMDFDHRPEEEKMFGLGTIGTKMATSDMIKRIETEVAKCDYICANCHRIRTKIRHG